LPRAAPRPVSLKAISLRLMKEFAKLGLLLCTASYESLDFGREYSLANYGVDYKSSDSLPDRRMDIEP